MEPAHEPMMTLSPTTVGDVKTQPPVSNCHNGVQSSAHTKGAAIKRRHATANAECRCIALLTTQLDIGSIGIIPPLARSGTESLFGQVASCAHAGDLRAPRRGAG